MSTTQQPTTRRTGVRLRSTFWFLVILAALSACSDAGRPDDDAQHRERTPHVRTDADRSRDREGSSEQRRDHEPGRVDRQRGEHGNEPREHENEVDEHENEVDEHEAEVDEHEADEYEEDEGEA